MAMHESIFDYSRYRYLWVSMVLSLGSIVAYLWHDPIGEPNGGSWLGYTLGTIGALLILWLLWFGIRKRSYKSRVGTMRGWLSAHVYLGTSLILIAFLHSGFQVGWNIHTLALVLMLIVIFSGFFGVYTYVRYPAVMTRNRDSATRQSLLDEIAELDAQALQLADTVDPKVHAAVLRSIERTEIGGSFITLLRPSDETDNALDQVKTFMEQRDKPAAGAPKKDMSTMFAMVDFLSAGSADAKSDALRKLLDTLARKRSLTDRITRDLQVQALMEIWLYVHVPLSMALLAALTAHVVSVFFYW
ncbi:MAG: hypothetical protein IPK97_14395 [Ahniella sp.]|nr:hypothetical protein [Ahniella sp.]